jgi:hypothetical protein
MCRMHAHEEVRDSRRERRAAWRAMRCDARRGWREPGWSEESEAVSPSREVSTAALTRAIDRLSSRIEVLERIVTTNADVGASEARLAAEIENLRGAGQPGDSGAEGRSP